MKKAHIDELKVSVARAGVTRRSFSGAGATLAWGTLQPGHEPRPHTHPHEQIVYIVSGHGTFTVGDETTEVKQGDMLVVPSGVLHYAVAGDEPLVDLSVFNPRRDDYYAIDERDEGTRGTKEAPTADRQRDIAHIGHAELLTPAPDESLRYFTELLGLTVVAEDHGSWYLRGHGDYEAYCLKLTAAKHAGLGHLALRTWSADALHRRVTWLKDAGIAGQWVEPEGGKGPAYEFSDPDGHLMRVYYETAKYRCPPGERPAMKSNHQRYLGRGANVRRLEHVNLMARDVRACREFWEDGFALRTFEIIRRDDGSEDGAWLSATVQGHEVIYVRDYLSGDGAPDGAPRARLHHLAFWVDSREDVLRAADLFNDACVPIEAGPSRHIPIQGFYLYTREPGGNRIEVCSGGYLGFDPDDDPVIWTAQEYATKPGWGARLPSTFRTYGTPATGAPEESVTSDWPAPAGLAPR